MTAWRAGGEEARVEAEEKFKEIGEAFDVLKDSFQKQLWDQGTSAAPPQHLVLDYSLRIPLSCLFVLPQIYRPRCEFGMGGGCIIVSSIDVFFVRALA